jgi:YopX protein.
MRTIKFRGKSLHNGKWVCGYLSDVDNTPIGKVGIINSKPFSGCEESTMVIAESIGQFTGVLDGRNQEIYENDIVATYFDGHCTYQGEVRFEAGRFIVSTNNGLLTNIGGKSWLVIGNIHDNPELMKGGEK